MPEALANQRHDARQGPERRRVAERLLRPALKVGRQLDAFQRLKAGFATGPSGMFEGLAAARRPSRMPASGELVAHATPPCHLSFGDAVLEELNRLHTPLFQRSEVSFHTFGITHIVLDGKRVIVFTILCNDQ